jgi:hypothetical protein
MNDPRNRWRYLGRRAANGNVIYVCLICGRHSSTMDDTCLPFEQWDFGGNPVQVTCEQVEFGVTNGARMKAWWQLPSDKPLTGRKCNRCDGPIMRSPLKRDSRENEYYEIGYACTCPGSESRVTSDWVIYDFGD